MEIIYRGLKTLWKIDEKLKNQITQIFNLRKKDSSLFDSSLFVFIIVLILSFVAITTGSTLCMWEAVGLVVIYFVSLGLIKLAKLVLLGQSFDRYFKGYLKLCTGCGEDLVKIHKTKVVSNNKGLIGENKESYRYEAVCPTCGKRISFIDHINIRLTHWEKIVKLISRDSPINK